MPSVSKDDMEDIHYLHRQKGTIESEVVYGERWLKLIYGNPLGKIFLWVAVKRAWFSIWYGMQMNRTKSSKKIRPFIQNYELDEKEFATHQDSFKSFNAFFSRKLTPNARPIVADDKIAVFPADGRHFGFQEISKMKGIFVKGQKFDLPELFQSQKLAESYTNGSLVISRLCPVDYHRFHFPVDGQVGKSMLVNGSLFSVNPIALRKRISIFWENKRYLSFLKSKYFGTIAQFLVGATCVGSVTFSVDAPLKIKKGDEFGFFSFGGSCVLTLFEEGQIKLSDDLVEVSANGMELYAKMGEEMGAVKNFVD